jgi:hypothetical protein
MSCNYKTPYGGVRFFGKAVAASGSTGARFVGPPVGQTTGLISGLFYRLAPC